MTLQEYQKQSKRTCPNLSDNLAVDLSHMVMGMNSEMSELEKAFIKKDIVNIGEELADNFGWYLANYCTFRNYDYSIIIINSNIKEYSTLSNRKLINSTYFVISELQDLVKKNLAYKKEINIQEEKELLFAMGALFNNFCKKNEIIMKTILENNINKLKIRFSDKFTENEANNRNLDAELIQLSKNI